MNFDHPPDRQAFEMLEHASRGLSDAAGGQTVPPYLIAVQVDDPQQPHGVAAHLVTNMGAETLRRALLDLLDRLQKPECVEIVCEDPFCEPHCGREGHNPY